MTPELYIFFHEFPSDAREKQFNCGSNEIKKAANFRINSEFCKVYQKKNLKYPSNVTKQ